MGFVRYVWQHWVFVITQADFEARQGNPTERPLFFLENKLESLDPEMASVYRRYS